MAFTYKFKVKPDPYQVDALKKALNHRKFGIFFQQRVGKTRVAIDFCGVTAERYKSNKVLIICPLSVRYEWVAQIDTYLPDRIDRDVFVYPKEKKARLGVLKKLKNVEKLTFIVLNYDILCNDWEALKNWNPDTIIFDESHKIGYHNSRRSKSAHKLAKESENVLLLTGTPIPKKWYQIFGQFRAMDDRIFGTAWTTFVNRWGVKGGFKGKEIVKCVDFEELSRIISDHSIRVLRKDVMDEVNVENVTIPVKLGKHSRKVYDELKNQFITELEGVGTITADLAGVRAMRLQQVCGGFIKTDDGIPVLVGTEKLDAAIDLIETHLEGDESVVVFHRFTAEGIALYDRLKRTYGEAQIGRINGAIPEVDRKYYRDEFQAGKRKIMLVQISTGAMGISLDYAHINIFYSMDFSLSNYQQARDRVMGRNQKDDVTNYFLSVEKTVDQKIMKTLQNDEDVASMISDRWRWFMEE